jgi:hypothetical protein
LSCHSCSQENDFPQQPQAIFHFPFSFCHFSFVIAETRPHQRQIQNANGPDATTMPR